MAELPEGMALGLLHEVVVVLQGGEPLEHRHDSIERLLHLAVVGLQAFVGRCIAERVLLQDRREAAGSPQR